MPNISKKTLLLIGGIVLVIAIIIGLVVSLTKKESSKETTKETTKERDNRLIKDALKRTGIQTINEPFQNNTEATEIVFDSYDKIKKNFDLFMNTYYPSMNINEMLKTKYEVPKTMQELIMENLDAPYMNKYIQSLFHLSLTISNSSLNDYLTKGISGDFICAFLAIIVLSNLNKRMNQKILYLNDFDKSDDFYIYHLPQSYDVSKLSTNNDIPIHMITYRSNNAIYYSGNDLIKPFKIGFISIIKYYIKESIQIVKSGNLKPNNDGTTVPPNRISSIPVSEDEINKFVKISGDYSIQILNYTKLIYTAGFIVLYNKKELMASSQIILDIKEIVKPSNFSEESKKIIPIPTADELDNLKFNDFGVL
jgi:hypothetical protein